jgi:hypothetical protein
MKTVIVEAICAVALFCGALALMLEYFDILIP